MALKDQRVKEGRQLLKNFEAMKDKAELNALSKYSLEHPLTDGQHRRMVELGKKVLGVDVSKTRERNRPASGKIILRRNRRAEEPNSIQGPVYWAENSNMQFSVSIVGLDHEMKIKISTPRGKNFENVAGTRAEVIAHLDDYINRAVSLFQAMEYPTKIEGKNIVILSGEYE